MLSDDYITADHARRRSARAMAFDRRRDALAAALAARRQWIPLAAGLLIVVIVGFFAARSVVQNERNDQQVKTSLALIAGADAVMLAVVEANSAQRGFIATGEAGFIGQFARSRDALARDVQGLKPLLARSSVAPGVVRQLEQQLAARQQEFATVDGLLADGDISAANSRVVASRDQTDAIRSALAAIKNHESRQLRTLQGVSRQSSERVRCLTIIGLASASILTLISIVLLARRSRALVDANTEIRLLADSLEQRVAERTAALEQANEEIQRFAYIVSHDLRSPLVNIMGFTSELEDAQQSAADYIAGSGAEGSPPFPPDVVAAITADMPEAMRFIRAASARMDRLIKAILQISRQGRRTLTREIVDLNAMFDDLGASLVAQMEAAGAQLQIGALPKVQSDRLALEQIFANLLDNAAKYLRKDVPGLITVAGEVRGNQVVIHVRDNGRGIAPNDRDRIFELFRRAGAQDQPGDGIGLTNVQALLRRLGGRIELESIVGEGSCFTATLPLRTTD